MHKHERPWWADHMPDTRAFVAVGYFILSGILLQMIATNPDKLLGNAAFMTVTTLIIGTGGLGVVGAFFFGGTKTGAEVMTSQSKTISDSAAGSTPPAPQPEGATQ